MVRVIIFARALHKNIYELRSPIKMSYDECGSQSLYESKPVFLIVVGTVLLMAFGEQFQFSSILFICAGTLIAKMRLSHRRDYLNRGIGRRLRNL
jgi:hypothetical protein